MTPFHSASAAKPTGSVSVSEERGVANLAQLPVETASLVKDINPGPNSSLSSTLFEAAGGVLYFGASDGVHGAGLWKSDGTPDGTVPVKDGYPSSVMNIENVGGTLFFSASDGLSGRELWRSDGTTDGTVMVKDILPGAGGSFPSLLLGLDGMLYFTATDATHGTELWVSHGTTGGTELLLDVYPGGASSKVENLTDVNGTLFFTANDGAHGVELWRSDGTPGGTVMVRDIYPGSIGSAPHGLTGVNGVLYFSATGDMNNYELWKSDGTETGTTLVKDIWPGSSGSDPLDLENVNGTLYFHATDGTHGYELWKSDGTAAGTVLVKDIWPGESGTGAQLAHIGGTAYFGANDSTNGAELWKSDGTAAGTVMVKDIVPGSGSSAPQEFVVSQNMLYFVANDGLNGWELWKSDGTDAGTALVADIHPAGDSWPSYPLDVDGTLYFRANDGVHGYELWKAGLEAVPETRVVTSTGDSGPGSLRQALSDAASGDTITFDPSLAGGTIALASTITLDKDLAIDGSSLDPRVRVSGDTDGDGTGDVSVFQVAVGRTVEITGIDIHKGFSGASMTGGGLNNFGDLSLADCSFSGNSGDQGGALHNKGALSVTNCSFTSNTALEGGAIFNDIDGTAVIANSTFRQNSAIDRGDLGGAAGAIGNVGTLSVTTSDFSENSAQAVGGAIVNSFYGSASVQESTLTGNTTPGVGGAIDNYSGTLTVTGSLFSNNTAGLGAAINVGDYPFPSYDSNVTIVDSSFSGNAASHIAGGLHVFTGAVTVSGSTFMDNTAESGGAIVHIQGTLEVANSSFYNNSSSIDPGGGLINGGSLTLTNSTFSGNLGGGLYNLPNGSLSLQNTILANSTSGVDCYNEGTLTGETHNLIEMNGDGSYACGTPISTADPFLGLLAENGGLTRTMSLLPGSPAIDAGDAALCPGTDQRGVTRPQGSGCDIGAYEYQGGPPPPGIETIPALEDWQAGAVAFSRGAEGEWDYYLWGGFANSLLKKDGIYYLYYQGSPSYDDQCDSVSQRGIGVATSPDGIHWTKSAHNPVISWASQGSVEEGAVSSAAWVGQDGRIYVYYGANTGSGCTVNASARLAVSEDGEIFQDLGEVLSGIDPDVWGAGDEIFPVGAYSYGDQWYLYYIPNGVKETRTLGLALGSAYDRFSQTTGINGGTVPACGPVSIIPGGSGSVLFTNPAGVDGPVNIYRFEAGNPSVVSLHDSYTLPDCKQASVLYESSAERWILSCRDAAAENYLIRQAYPGSVLEEYTLTVTGEHGTVTKTPDQATYQLNDVVQLTAIPEAGWSFDSWSGDASGADNPLSLTIDGDKAVTATFTQDEYTLTVNVVGNGLVTKDPEKTTYQYSETVLLTATPDPGWSFTGWSGDATGSVNPFLLTIDGNKMLSATFTMGESPGGFNKSWPTSGRTGQAANTTLYWDRSSGVSSYEYCYDTTDDGACSSWVSAGTSTYAALSGLSPNTTYYWQVRAVNGFGSTYANGSETAYWSFTTGVAPGAFNKSWPSNGRTGQNPNTTLYWAPSSGASSYEYCYDTTDDGACSSWVSTGTSTYASLSGLSPNTTYYWQVRAVSSFGSTYANGSETAYWSFTTGAIPGGFNKSWPANGLSNQSSSPTLYWARSSNVSSYEYCYDTTDDDTCTTWVSAGTSTYAALSGLSSNTTYYWQVRAVNGFGTTFAQGSETAYWSFTTGAIPGGFNKSWPANGLTNQSSSPTLYWAPSSGASLYEYCYDTTNDGACSSWVGVGTSKSAALSGLSSNTTYYWQVRAVNGFGTTYAQGSDTAYWSFTTGAIPGGFNKSWPANGLTNQSSSPTLYWAPSSGASLYEYCYDTTDDDSCTTWESASTSKYVALSGLSPNTTYYWQVRAVNSLGTTYAQGSETAYWSFTTAP